MHRNSLIWSYQLFSPKTLAENSRCFKENKNMSIEFIHDLEDSFSGKKIE